MEHMGYEIKYTILFSNYIQPLLVDMIIAQPHHFATYHYHCHCHSHRYSCWLSFIVVIVVVVVVIMFIPSNKYTYSKVCIYNHLYI